MGKLVLALGWWGVTALVFWGIFFKLTPLVTNLIPSGEWQCFLKVLIYILVGYIGINTVGHTGINACGDGSIEPSLKQEKECLEN